MPYATVTLKRTLAIEETRSIVRVVQDAMQTALGHPERGSVRVLCLEPAAFSGPPHTTDDFTLIEISMFKGRSRDTKRRLYGLLFEGMNALGTGPKDIRILVSELDAENMGLSGGRAACDVDLGYKVDV